jgi:undecaprenyl pyrophosphate synthase
MEAMMGAQRLWERLGAWARRAAAAVLSSARRPVPRHVAFIMDGNRRYAEAHQLRKVEGHAYGYQRLIDALEWCLELGVSCVSVYAFSIDNYRRSGEEVATLMQLAEEKLAHMLQVCGMRAVLGCSSRSRNRSVGEMVRATTCRLSANSAKQSGTVPAKSLYCLLLVLSLRAQEHDVLVRHGVQVRVIGDLSLAPPGVQAAAAAIMDATRHHGRAVLNLCFSYT